MHAAHVQRCRCTRIGPATHVRYAPKIDHATDSRTCRPYTRERSCGISTENCRRGRSTSTTGRGTRKKKKKRPRSRANRRIDSRDLGRAPGAPSAEYRNNTLDAPIEAVFRVRSRYISLPYTYIMTLTVLTVPAVEATLYVMQAKKNDLPSLHSVPAFVKL